MPLDRDFHYIASLAAATDAVTATERRHAILQLAVHGKTNTSMALEALTLAVLEVARQLAPEERRDIGDVLWKGLGL